MARGVGATRGRIQARGTPFSPIFQAVYSSHGPVRGLVFPMLRAGKSEIIGKHLIFSRSETSGQELQRPILHPWTSKMPGEAESLILSAAWLSDAIDGPRRHPRGTKDRRVVPSKSAPSATLRRSMEDMARREGFASERSLR